MDDDQPAVLSVVCLLLIAACIYLAVAVIDWQGHWVGAVGFCVIVPSVITAALGGVVRVIGRR